jgi:hypothetical protein
MVEIQDGKESDRLSEALASYHWTRTVFLDWASNNSHKTIMYYTNLKNLL